MKDLNEVSCGCYGPLVTVQEKMFLAKKHSFEEQEPLLAMRKTNKSTENKNESQGKVAKKSLRRRSASTHMADQSLPVTNEANKSEPEGRINPQEQFSTKNKFSWNKGGDTSICYQQQPSAGISSIKFPQNAFGQRQSNFINPHWESTMGAQPGSYPAIVSFPNFTSAGQFEKSGQVRPQVQQVRNHAINYTKQPSVGFQVKLYPTQGGNLKQMEQKQTSVGGMLPQQSFWSNIRLQQRRKVRKQSESLSPQREDLREGLEKFVRGRAESKFSCNLQNEYKSNAHPRQAQRARQLQKQQLFGRLAQSDGEDNDSESSPSEVIGRGFDRSYQELLLEDEQDGVVEETKASRSTNTKMSELQIDKRVGEHAKDVFGSPTLFKTYKFL